MAKPTVNSRCGAFIELHNPLCGQCNDFNGVYKCRGCFKTFCEQHVIPHRESMKTKLHELRREVNSIKTEMDESDLQRKSRLVLEDINQWQQQSIREINRVADEARAEVSKAMNDGGHGQRNQILVCHDVFRTRLEEAERNNDYHERHLEYWQQFLIDLQKNFQRIQIGYVRLEYGDCLVRNIHIQSGINPALFEFTKWCYFERNCGPCYDIALSGSYKTGSCCQETEVPPCRDRYTETGKGNVEVRQSWYTQQQNSYTQFNDGESRKGYHVDHDDRVSESSASVRRSLYEDNVKE